VSLNVISGVSVMSARPGIVSKFFDSEMAFPGMQ